MQGSATPFWAQNVGTKKEVNLHTYNHLGHVLPHDAAPVAHWRRLRLQDETRRTPVDLSPLSALVVILFPSPLAKLLPLLRTQAVRENYLACLIISDVHFPKAFWCRLSFPALSIPLALPHFAVRRGAVRRLGSLSRRRRTRSCLGCWQLGRNRRCCLHVRHRFMRLYSFRGFLELLEGMLKGVWAMFWH